jgi:catechol 2,3-dioxygenase-like lactoylglutathione lyase family enzyme
MKQNDAPLQGLPPITGVVETALYVDDLSRSVGFYEGLFGFRILQQDHRFCAFDVAGRSILLLFLRGASLEPAPLPWGDVIPPHDGKGPLHFAFAIPRGSDGAWETHLRNAGVTIESAVVWPRGGRSLYFRDPDGHAVELLTPGVWETY